MHFIKISPVWILIGSLYGTGPARALGFHQKPPFISAKAGDAVTLSCTSEERLEGERLAWYKQRMGQAPQLVGTGMLKSGFKKAPEFEQSGMKLEANRSSMSLTIPHITKDDEGTYFCGLFEVTTVKFSNGTFLAVAGHPELNISVLQSPASASVPPGERLTLQCSVLSEIRAAELRVFWFRAAAGPSSPEIIYTHQSSRQCEISSSPHSCVSNFSKNVLSENDTGTFYCAVAACGKILLGNGTKVVLAKPPDPAVISLGAALGVCVVVIFAQAVFIFKKRNNKHEKPLQVSVNEKQTKQDHDEEELNYAALSFHEKTTKRGRRKREQPQESLYSEVKGVTFNHSVHH